MERLTKEFCYLKMVQFSQKYLHKCKDYCFLFFLLLTENDCVSELIYFGGEKILFLHTFFQQFKISITLLSKI